MRQQEIIGIVKENVLFALVVVCILGILFCIGLLVYKKLGGAAQISKKRVLLIVIFSMYLIMVLGVTFLNRGANFQGLSLSLFSSYRDAWHNYSIRGWQNIYLNILMFVPFGFFYRLFRHVSKKYVGQVDLHYCSR